MGFRAGHGDATRCARVSFMYSVQHAGLRPLPFTIDEPGSEPDQATRNARLPRSDTARESHLGHRRDRSR